MPTKLSLVTSFGRARKRKFHSPEFALVVAALALAAWACAGKAEPANPAGGVKESTTVAPRDQLIQDRVEAETLTLSPAGFEPTEIRRPGGRFLLALNNLSELEEAVVRLEQEDGQVLWEVRLPHRQQKWRQVVDLAPGNYTLTEVNHSEWRCQITIE